MYAFKRNYKKIKISMEDTMENSIPFGINNFTSQKVLQGSKTEKEVSNKRFKVFLIFIFSMKLWFYNDID